MINRFFKKEVLDRLNSGMMDKLYLLLKICKENFPATSVKGVQREFDEYEYIDFFIDPCRYFASQSANLSRTTHLVNILVRLSITKIESEKTSLEQYELLRKANVPHVYSRKMVESFCTVFDFAYAEKKRFFTRWRSHQINFIMDFLTSMNQIRPFLLLCFIKSITY